MPPILSLRHYSHELLCHSHEHAQLVFGLAGELQFEVDGQGTQVQLLPENPDFTPILVDTRRDALVIEGIGVGIIRNGKAL